MTYPNGGDELSRASAQEQTDEEYKLRVRLNVNQMSNEQCVHHWVIDKFNVGRCKNCPAVRDFGALMSKEVAKVPKVPKVPQLAQEHGAKRGRKKKQATSKP